MKSFLDDIIVTERDGQVHPACVDLHDPSYLHVNLNDPIYAHAKAMIDRGRWACDSIDHNETTGCSNPVCFKHPENLGKPWSEPVAPVCPPIRHGC